MHPDQLKSDLNRILQTFPPELYPEIRFGGSYYIILEAMLRLESKTIPLTQGSISQQIKQNESSNNTLVALDNIMPLLAKLEINKLLTPEGKDIYKFAENVPRSLGEFLGTIPYKRKGRVGFVRYMKKSLGRLILWYALCHPNSIEPKGVKEQLLKIIKVKNDEDKKKKEECINKYLKRFITDRKPYLSFDSKTQIFKLADVNEKKVFDELYSDYESFIAPRLTLREPILSLAWQHKLLSSRLMIQELEELGFEFDPSTVHKQMKQLIHDGIFVDTNIREKGKKTGQGLEKFYSINFSVNPEHNKTMCKEIHSTLNRYKFKTNKKMITAFLRYAASTEPNELEVFFRELRFGFLLRDMDQTASICLWLSFISGLLDDKFLLSDFKFARSKTMTKEELAEKLASISQEKRISALAVVLIYLSASSCSPES